MLFSKRSLPFCSILFFIFLTLNACQSDAVDDLVETTAVSESRSFPDVDERLWPYFERFETEGQKLGLDIDLAGASISGVIENLEGEHVAGQCTTFGSFRPSRVTVDSEFWNRASDLFKEFIIFHELGHCYLNRDHREDAFTNGRCVSIMRSGTLDCRDNYNVATRNAYIQELFDPATVRAD